MNPLIRPENILFKLMNRTPTLDTPMRCRTHARPERFPTIRDQEGGAWRSRSPFILPGSDLLDGPTDVMGAQATGPL